MAASPGHVEVFFEAVSTNDYRLRKGDSLTNPLIAEMISEASGIVSRQYPITGPAGFFTLEPTPVPPPLGGFGEISGRAFVLDEELTHSLAWDNLDAAVKSDTIVCVTATLGDDGFLY